ncbi:MAG: radical SAM/SPASM domain-containing protein [Alphaproteobacteria bacterium]
MDSTNRTWQRHIWAKGVFGFFLDRLQQHALSSAWQHKQGPFSFPIGDPETEDELSRAYFGFVEHFPYEFYIEATNHCNLDCTMCARTTMKRPLGTMPMDLFRKIIDEIAEKQPHAFIHYYGIGESMVDKKLFEKLAYSRDKGLRNSLLFTNGQLLLTKENYKTLAESGLSNIGVDLDGFSAEAYEKVRIGGSYEKARDGIVKLYDYIREHNIRTRVELAYQIVPGINEHDIAPFVAWCDANNYEYKLVTMHDWAGMRDDIGKTQVDGLADMHHVERKTPCAFLWNGFSIAWDGRVTVCFHDADIRECLGDLNTSSIEDIWTGTYREKRREHVAGHFKGVCAECTTGAAVRLPQFGSKLYPESLHAPQA